MRIQGKTGKTAYNGFVIFPNSARNFDICHRDTMVNLLLNPQPSDTFRTRPIPSAQVQAMPCYNAVPVLRGARAAAIFGAASDALRRPRCVGG